MRIRQILGSLIMILAVLAPVSGDPSGAPSTPGPSNPGPSGPPSTPPVLGPGRAEGAPGTTVTVEEQAEEPVGDVRGWLAKNPKPGLVALIEVRGDDNPDLMTVLNALTPSELADLAYLLQVYQVAINNHVARNPRAIDTAPGSIRNSLNIFSGDVFVRGCADMSEQANLALGPHTGGTRPFTVHPYRWKPNAVRQVGILAGLPLAAAAIGKCAATGASVAGPWGLAAGGAVGLAVAFSTGNTEHNMAAIRSTRNPNLIIVLDPHAAQSGGLESVHGPDYYSGPTGRPELGAPQTPATPNQVQPGSQP